MKSRDEVMNRRRDRQSALDAEAARQLEAWVDQALQAFCTPDNTTSRSLGTVGVAPADVVRVVDELRGAGWRVTTVRNADVITSICVHLDCP